MISQFRITDTWQAITSPGESGNVWIIESKIGRIKKADVIIYHSDSIVPTGNKYNTKSKMLFRPDSNQGLLNIIADNPNDIYYAKCLTAGSRAKINVDASIPNAKIIEENSTSTPLIADDDFTGDAVNILNAEIIFISIYSDVASAEDGLSIQQSIDGTNWDHSDEYTVPAARGKNYSINPHAAYFRIVYTNGTSPQNVFRLQVIAKGNSKPSSHKIASDITSDDDSELITAVIKVQTNDPDTYVNVDVDNPFPTDGDQVYGKDIVVELSDPGDFIITSEPTANDREILTSMVSDVHIEKKNDTATNPKQITMTFKRPVLTSSFGIDSGPSGNFSNVKITVFQGQFSAVVVDESADNTKYTIRLFDVPPLKFSKMLIEFHTADTVTMGLLGIFKNTEVAARLQALNDAGTVEDISCTNQGNLKIALQEYGDTPSIDAFDRLRISSPYTIFDSKQLHDKQPLFWDEETGGSATATHNSANAAVEMAVTANAADYVIRQTKQRFNYQPGKSQLCFITFYCPQESGMQVRLGMFDGTGVNYLTPNNGIFLEITDSDISWNIAKNGSTTESISQSSWNFDKLDGEGFSGKTLDLDAAQIIVIDYEWLGVGRVRVGFVIDGLIYYCHYFNHANDPTFDSVYMSTPNLPIRYSIETDGSAVAQLDHICSTVMSEGGLEETGVLRSVDTGTTHLTASAANTTYALIGIRLKAAYIDVTIIPEFFSMLSETADSFRWSILLNPTVDDTFTFSDIANSAIQRAIGVTANDITDEGFVIDSGYVAAGNVTGGGDSQRKIVTALKMGSKIDGTVDVIVLAVTPLSASAEIQGSLTVRELL